MLTYSFEDIGSVSLYEHLYRNIKEDIIKGALAAGDKLPSKRSFAKNLGVSVITVENAYAQLIAEGYVYSLPKKGFFVADLVGAIAVNAGAPTNDIIEVKAEKVYFADFTSNQTAPENFPFSVWTKLMREIIADSGAELMVNPPSRGIYELREAIALHLRDFRGMRVNPEQIVIGAGTEYLYGLIIQLLGHDKIYAVENPGYKKIFKIYRSNNVNVGYVGMDENGLRIEELEKSHSSVAHISPSHHFPTGLVMPISRRYELLAWAAKSSERYIIEDDYDCEFRFVGKPIPSLQSIDAAEKVIYINTFTKSLAPTIRISYMILPIHLTKRYCDKMSFYSCTVSNFEQYTLARFIREKYFEKHINRMRNFYRTQRDMILNCIKESRLASCVKITEEDSGLHFLLSLKTKLSEKEFLSSLAEKGVRLSCLSEYYYDNIDDTHIYIINYSSIKPDRIRDAVARIYESAMPKEV